MKTRAPRTALETLPAEERRRWRLITGPNAEQDGPVGSASGGGPQADGEGKGGAGKAEGAGGKKAPMLFEDEQPRRAKSK